MKKFEPTTGFVHVGELFVCNCGIPLARKTDMHEFELIKFHRGKPVVTVVNLINGAIQCPVCSRGFANLTISESLTIS